MNTDPFFGPGGIFPASSAQVVGSTYGALPQGWEYMSPSQKVDAWMGTFAGPQAPAFNEDVANFKQWLQATEMGYDVPQPQYSSNFNPSMISAFGARVNPNTQDKSDLTKLAKTGFKYAPMLASFGAGAGMQLPGFLGDMANGTSFLGKVGQAALGGGKFSNNALFDYGAKALLGSKVPGLGQNILANQAGGFLGPMLGLTPRPQVPGQQGATQPQGGGTDYRPGGGYGAQGATGGGIKLPTGSPEGLSDLNDYGMGNMFKAFGTGGNPNATPMPGFGGSATAWGMDPGKMQSMLDMAKGATGIFNAGKGAGANAGYPQMSQIQTGAGFDPGKALDAGKDIFNAGKGAYMGLNPTPQGTGYAPGGAPGGGNSGSTAAQLAALALMSQMFNKKDKDPPAPAAGAGPLKYADLGLITNQNAQQDQLNRLRAAKANQENPYLKGVA